eukprot:g2998.t1
MDTTDPIALDIDAVPDLASALCPSTVQPRAPQQSPPSTAAAAVAARSVSSSLSSTTDISPDVAQLASALAAIPDTDDPAVAVAASAKILQHTPASLKVLLSNNRVGAVIGSRGVNIARIRQSVPTVRISVSANNSSGVTAVGGSEGLIAPGERLVTLSGTYSTVLEAFALIWEQAAAAQKLPHATPGGGASDASGAADIDMDAQEPLALVLAVPAVRIGAVIGRDGANIGATRQRSGAVIHIARPTDMPPGCTGRRIHICGDATQCETAVRDIAAGIQLATARAQLRSQKRTASASATGRAVSALSAEEQQAHQVGGATAVSTLFVSSPASVLHTKTSSGAASASLFGFGPSQASGVTAASTAPLMAMLQNESSRTMMRPETQQQANATPPAASASGVADGVVRATVVLQVSDSCIGRVIGRGGSSLNHIRLMTGASIDVSGSSTPGAVRPVSISGTAAQVQAAQAMVTRKVVEAQQRGIDNEISIAPLAGGAVGNDADTITGGVSAGSSAVSELTGTASAIGEVVEQIVVAGDAVGRVIGKGGANIAQIRQATGAKIDIVAQHGECQTDNNTITVRGTKEQVQCARILLGLRLAQIQPVVDHANNDHGTVGNENGNAARVHRLLLNIPNQIVGRLIGTGGSVIRAIRERSGARVELQHVTTDVAVDAGTATNGNRSLVISGRTLQVRLARDLVSARICGAEVHDLLGVVAGEHCTPTTGAVPFGMRGRSSGLQQQQSLGYTTPVGRYTLRDAPTHGLPYTSSVAMNIGSNVTTSNLVASSPAPQALTVRMQVPNESAGRIIGRGGSNVAEIRSRSGARVDIARHVPLQPVRDITIVGDHVQVQQAQMLIAAKMAEEIDVSHS